MYNASEVVKSLPIIWCQIFQLFLEVHYEQVTHLVGLFEALPEAFWRDPLVYDASVIRGRSEIAKITSSLRLCSSFLSFIADDERI